MTMTNIDEEYISFIEKFKIVLQFISEKMGDKDILIRKNKGFIQDRNIQIKGSKITGYIFHGSGCEFRFKNHIIDIYFDNDKIGFTTWSFYTYMKSVFPEISEIETENYLHGKMQKGQLDHNGVIYRLK